MPPISRVLQRIDGRGYKAYKDLLGAGEEVDGVRVTVVRVQGDPFAPPSVVRLEAYMPVRERLPLRAPIAVADYIHRLLVEEARRNLMRGVGEGHSGLLSLPRPAPIMIPRSAVEARPQGMGFRVVARLWAGLPSRRRRVLAGEAEELLLVRAPRALKAALRRASSSESLLVHARTWLEQEHIRRELRRLKLAAFVGDGSVLPRACGGCWEPLEGAVPFESPASLRVEMELPTGRSITGMGVPLGLALISGPAFHGKTTLAEAIYHGVWNHVPGDGRELVVSREELFYVESENGRWVSCVDITPFILSLPGQAGEDLECFSTRDASGATSIAASVQEAVEAGAEVIVVDEDTAATNFIHRDFWAEEVTGKRTLNPLSEEAPEMARSGVGVVAVVSGSPQLLARADAVIVMDEYRARDAGGYRERALRALEASGYRPGGVPYRRPRPRRVARPVAYEKAKVRGARLEVKGGPQPFVDLSSNRQLEEEAQLHTAVTAALRIASRRGVVAVEEARRISVKLWTWDYSWLGREPGPDVSYVRPLDIMFVVNRLPGLAMERV